MAGEVIRDVIVKLRLQMADDKALRGGVERIKEGTAATDKGTESVKRQKTAVDGVEAAQKRLAQVERDRLKLQTEIEKKQRAQIELEKQQVQLLRTKEQIAAKAAAAASKATAGTSGKPPAGGSGSDSFVGAAIGSSGLKVAQITASALILSQIPDWLKSLSSGSAGKGVSKWGGDFLGGASSLYKGVGVTIADLLGGSLGKGADSFLRRGGPVGIYAGVGADYIRGSDPANKMRVVRDPRSAEQIRRDELIEKLQNETRLREQQIDLVRKIIDAEDKLLKIDRDKINEARGEFGMMNRMEQQSLLEVSKKVKTGGTSSLNMAELEIARSSPLFADLLKQNGLKTADTAGFAEILKNIGVQDKLDRANAAIQTKVSQVNNLNVQLSDFSKLGDELEKKIAPMIAELNAKLLEKLDQEIERSARRAHQTRPGF